MSNETQPTQAEIFIQWLDQIEAQTGLSDYQIAKKGGFSHSALSRARAGTPPGYDICARIADVVNVSPITAFRKAGLLQQGYETEASLQDWEYLLNQLPPDEQQEVHQIALMKVEKRQKAEAAERAANFKPKQRGG